MVTHFQFVKCLEQGAQFSPQIGCAFGAEFGSRPMLPQIITEPRQPDPIPFAPFAPHRKIINTEIERLHNLTAYHTPGLHPAPVYDAFLTCNATGLSVGSGRGARSSTDLSRFAPYREAPYKRGFTNILASCETFRRRTLRRRPSRSLCSGSSCKSSRRRSRNFCKKYCSMRRL